MFENKSLLRQIFLKTDSGDKYIVFEHDDKTWLLPMAKLKPALEMYQPSTRKGRILKKLVRYCNGVSFVASKIGVNQTTVSVNENIKEYISSAIGTNDFYIAGYMGDTSSKQNDKVTLQIYNDKELVCYAKITKNPEVSDTFKHEIEALRFLEDKGIKNVPKVLGEDCIDGMNIFLQTTEKPLYQKVRLDFEKEQIEFICKMVDASNKKLDYKETDFYNSVQYLKANLDDFNAEEKVILKNSIEKIEEVLSKKTSEYSFSHGDYTPWNVYYKDGILHAFDFEYCSYTMPSFIDVFHYLTQMSLLGFNEEVGKTIHIYKKNRKLLEQYICNPDFTYLCYLLSIVSFYKKRTEYDAESVNEKYSKWIGIMDYLNDKIK